jgi:ATP-dependent RNA helicase DeaD
VVDFEALHLSPAIAAAVSRLGWTADDPVMRDAAPTAARGHNLIAVVPPTPAAATPALAGMLSRLGGGTTGLLLVAEADLEEWAGRVHLLAADAGLNVLASHGTGRAARRLRGDKPVDLLVTSPETALALHSRSALRPETLSSVLLAWPEAWYDEAGFAAVMQDLPKEAQRIVVTGAADRAADMVERYARRALAVSAPGLDGVVEPAGSVRTVSLPWNRRAGALADLVELLDPASLVIWTLDRGHDAAIRQAVAPADPSVRIVTGDAPNAQTIIAFDPPTPIRLRQLAAAGEVVVLTPPAAESYVRRIASIRRPLRLSSSLDAAVAAAETRRAAIVRVLERGSLDRALLTIAPLIERYDSAAVAAALFDLWLGTGAEIPAAPAQSSDIPATAKVFVGIGKKDGATVNDLVAVLTKEVRVERGKIGRVELRDGFMLVEVPAQEAEQVATALNGKTIRRKRVTARVDRGSDVAGRKSQVAGPKSRRN